MGGIASVVWGALIAHGVVQPEILGKPSYWWWTAGACFFWATALAWRDEHRERARVEERGPNLVLEFFKSVASGGRVSISVWTITNSGDVDAVNITCDPIQIRDAKAKIRLIQRIGEGASTEALEWEEWINDRSIGGHHAHPGYLLDNAIKKQAETMFTGAEFVNRLGDWVIPIRLTCKDPSGVDFENIGEIHWNVVLEQGYVTPIRWARIRPASRWSL